MAHHDVVDNNPKKEILTALIGIVLLLALIAGIAVFAWLRPAGEHPVIIEQTSDSAELVNTEAASTAPAQSENAGEAVAPQTATEATSGTSAPAEQTDATTPPDADSTTDGDTATAQAVTDATADTDQVAAAQ